MPDAPAHCKRLAIKLRGDVAHPDNRSIVKRFAEKPARRGSHGNVAATKRHGRSSGSMRFRAAQRRASPTATFAGLQSKACASRAGAQAGHPPLTRIRALQFERRTRTG
jgi:hypothetical protein